MRCDFHIHLLPDIDNGPADIRGSLALLRRFYENGGRMAVLTPHFDAERESLPSFLQRRAESEAVLRNYLSDFPDFRYLLSAEAACVRGISRLSNLDRLLIPGSRLLPLTLPIGSLDSATVKELAHLIQKRNIHPLICHTERYFLMYPEADFHRLTATLPHAVYQFSTAALLLENLHPALRQMIREGRRLVLGSNAHNDEERSINGGKSSAGDKNSSFSALYDLLTQSTESLLSSLLSVGRP